MKLSFALLLFIGLGLAYSQISPDGTVEFSCENTSLSDAISQLSSKSHVPINSIIDELTEPRITIPPHKGTASAFLDEIVAQAPAYGKSLRSGAILVCPKGLEGNAAFPLNQRFKKYDLKYSAYKRTTGKTVYRCEFIDQQGSSINVAMGAFILTDKPDYQDFSKIVNFENQTLLEILLSLSAKHEIWWCCAKLQPSYVHEANKRMVEKSWKNEDAPCYQVFWRNGGYHGEDLKAHDQAMKVVQEYWVRHAAIKRARENGAGPVSLQISTEQPGEKDAPIFWRFRLKNQGATAIRFANPWRNTEGAFFAAWRYIDQNGQHGEYQLELKASDLAREPAEISLAPGEELEKNLNIRGATMTLDTTRTDPQFKGKEKEVVGPGKYMVLVSMYYKDASGKEYCSNVSEAVRFEVKDKAAAGSH
ncbi:MAG: hypothetical protein PHV34_22765 [Verrucomicrobiae bacterium]|nr:hypothetical protein [Verrucomicrobiae bacterium]